jgi:LmbE family N-acetylglucosaminyl deacetylase
LEKKIVVFAPHPDDETFGCGGTIAKRISEGYEVLIVVLTDGRYAFLKVFGIENDPTPEELKDIRKEEVKRATRILGVPEKNLIFLDFLDGTLKDREEEAKQKVMEILGKNNPVEVYIPYKKDAHPDHYATYRIVKDSIKELRLSTAIYQYSIAQKYAYFAPIIDAWLNPLKRSMVHVDISKFLAAKKNAAREFKSEFTTISSKQLCPLTDDIKEFTKRFLNCKEAFYIEK